MDVIIAGAGIAGLTLALSLHQVRIPCRVFESVDALAPLGVGINVLPHAVRELTELGLQARLAETGIATAALAYHSRHGQLIWREPRGVAAGYRWPQFSIHRGALQMILLAAVRARLGADAVRMGHRLVGVEQDGDGAVARFAGGAVARGAVVVGADGIHSALRAQFVPGEGAPIWNGAILWRGTTEAAPFLGGRTMIMAGHEFQKFVAYPISAEAEGHGRSLVNWIAEKKFSTGHAWRREDWNRAADLADFAPDFATWRFDWLDIPALIAGAGAVYEYPMVDRDPLPCWTHGRATLLGDAAHPMYPIGSNGASQGILDARVLTREFLAHGVGAAALAAYEAERRPATSRIVLANRGNGPEQVMQMVQERAPDGFSRIEDVLSTAELEGAAAGYKRLAGFDVGALNSRAPIVAVGGVAAG
jgi:2-polyprenyl-6-methoxyphenol hydroxylase-like FAD-dependent oxidoreductase